MGEQDIELTAYCGLYCGDCIRYKSRAADVAQDLLAELENTDWDKYAEMSTDEAFKHYQLCQAVLKAIVRRKCNEPCRVGGGCPTFSCRIIECCREKGLEGCWECGEFEECSEFDFLKPLHGDASVQNLKKIKELGLNDWVQQRHKFYVWQ
jgi:hypothetical protein